MAHPDRVAKLVLDSVVPAAGLDGLEVDGLHETARVLRAVCRAQHCPGDPAADLAAVVRARHDGWARARRHARRAERRRAELPGRARRAARGPRRATRSTSTGSCASCAAPSARPRRCSARGCTPPRCAPTRSSPWGGAGAPLAGREAALAGAAAADRPRALRPRDGRRQRLRAAVPALAAHAGAAGAAHGRPAAGADAAAGRRPRPLDAAAVGARAGRAHAARPARRRPRRRALGAVAGAPAARAAAPSQRFLLRLGSAPCSRATRRMRGRLLVTALEEARALRSDAIGTGHLLLGVTRTLPLLVPLRAEDVRARLGTGDAAEEARAALHRRPPSASSRRHRWRPSGSATGG